MNINRLLTEREGRTGEYWPEVVAVGTERSEVRTATTSSQYSPSAARASSVSKLFIKWHSVSDSKMQILNLPASLQNKNTRVGPFPWKRSVLQNPDRERTNQSTGICLRLGLPYNNRLYCPRRCSFLLALF